MSISRTRSISRLLGHLLARLVINSLPPHINLLAPLTHCSIRPRAPLRLIAHSLARTRRFPIDSTQRAWVGASLVSIDIIPILSSHLLALEI